MPRPLSYDNCAASSVRSLGNDQRRRQEKGEAVSGQRYFQRAISPGASNQPIATCSTVLTLMAIGTILDVVKISNAAVSGSPSTPPARARCPAMASLHGGAQKPVVPFFGPELDSAWPLPLINAEGDASAVGTIGHLMEYYFSDPCIDPDTAANSGWRAMHPGGRRVTTRFSEIRRRQAEDRISQLRTLPLPTDSPAKQALRNTWASAYSTNKSWTAFSDQSANIDQLADRAGVEQHLCAAMIKGQSALLTLEHVLGMHVLDATPTLPPSSSERVYALDDDANEVQDHLATLASLLVDSGMPAALCAPAAATCHAMEKIVAQSGSGLSHLDLAGAQSQAPSFPWATLWSSLELDQQVALYINVPTFRGLGQLLDTRSVEDWKCFLRYQEALQAQPYIAPPGSVRLIGQLDQPDIGDAVFSAMYAESFLPERAKLTSDMLAAIVAQFIADIRGSAFAPADQDLLCDALDSLKVHLGTSGAGQTWPGTSAKASFLHNIQALRTAQLDHHLQAVRQGILLPGMIQSTHHLYSAVSCQDAQVVVTRAMINGILDAFGESLEGRWATLGSLLGHEVAHCLTDVTGLSPQAHAMLQQRKEAVRQRVESTYYLGPALDASQITDEAACDLSGMATARRAGQAQAALQARTFDDVVFFQKAAELHAANPTPSQLKALSTASHPPPAFRAALVREVAGFETAHGCTPGARAPFGHVL